MKKLTLLLLYFCTLLPSFAFGAVAVDGTTSVSAHNVTVETFAHTITGTNTLLLCTVAGSNGRTITSYTYDGVSMTLVNREDNVSSGVHYVAIYALVTGTGSGTPKNAEVTLNAIEAVAASCTSFTGVNQTTPTGTSAKSNNSGGLGSPPEPATSITIAANGLGFDVGMLGLSPHTCGDEVPGGSQTQRFDFCDIDDSAQSFGSTISTTGSQSFTWTLHQSSDWAQIAVPINAIVAPSRRRVVVIQ